MASKPYNTSPQNNFRTYPCAEVVIFQKTKERFGGLSNMAAGYPLHINGVNIRTSEALYQACRYPHLPEAQLEIINQQSPMTAKMKSKLYRKDTREDWEQIRFKVMRWCLRVKLAQNFETFGDLLLSTKDKHIVEQSKKDLYWGAKLSEDNKTLTGQNILGRLLMELREKLKTDQPEELKIVTPPNISNFILLGLPLSEITSMTYELEQNHSRELF